MLKTIDELQDNRNRIDGVEFKLLKTWPDDRGFFREIIRFTDPFFSTDGFAANQFAPEHQTPNFFAQWSHSKMAKNTVKAWHYHHLQTDFWYIGIGVIHTVLFDLREESPTYERKLEWLMGDPSENEAALPVVVRIPPGVAHGLKVLTDFSHLFYITSQTYNPQDEGRHRFNSPRVPHSWGEESSLIVAPNDQKDFIPTATRALLRK